jgi:hypothetical protein
MDKTYYFIGKIEDLEAYGFEVYDYETCTVLEREDLFGGDIVINKPLLDIEKEEADIEFDLEAILESLIKDNKVLII